MAWYFEFIFYFTWSCVTCNEEYMLSSPVSPVGGNGGDNYNLKKHVK